MQDRIEVTLRDSVSNRYRHAASLVLPVGDVDLKTADTGFYAALNELSREGQDPGKESQALEQIEHWKSVYKDMNLPRGKGISSIEALYKRVKKSGRLPAINPFVDLYNSVSLNTRTCIGAYDARKLQGNIEIKVVPDDEEMFAIGGAESLLVKRGSVAYYDDAGIICSYWNCRDAHRTAIDASTTQVVVAIDVGTDANAAWRAAELLATLSSCLGGRAGTPVMIDGAHPQHSFLLTQGG